MSSKFETFAALHVPGAPVVLYNIWDVGSALAVVKAGAKSLATGSHPVADANGWPDGEQVPIDFALANARRIVEAVDLPLTVDFEGAYSADPEEGARNVARLKETGAVGCNFEDQRVGDEGLHPLELQCRTTAWSSMSSSGARPSPMQGRAGSSFRALQIQRRSNGSCVKCRCR
jgi:2-methylisocitrate lyase-like PEP mutase family enzyme